MRIFFFIISGSYYLLHRVVNNLKCVCFFLSGYLIGKIWYIYARSNDKLLIWIVSFFLQHLAIFFYSRRQNYELKKRFKEIKLETDRVYQPYCSEKNCSFFYTGIMFLRIIFVCPPFLPYRQSHCKPIYYSVF